MTWLLLPLGAVVLTVALVAVLLSLTGGLMIGRPTTQLDVIASDARHKHQTVRELNGEHTRP